jgi:hypothetical protein
LDNVFTQSLDDAKAGKTTVLTDAQMDKLTTKQYYSLMENTSDKYNCWGSALAGRQGKEIKAGVGIGQGATFDNALNSSYQEASGNYKFGETVVRFANEGNVTHGAVYYGTSKNGDVYVYTKNGWLAYPKFMKLDDLMKSIPSYGTPTGIKSTESGFYNRE